MSKLNKKLIAAGLGAAAVAATVPVILTSCSQNTEQNSGQGQDQIINEGIVTTNGNSYSEAIIIDGAESVESIKSYFLSNADVLAKVEESLLSNKAKFNHVDIEFSDVVKNNDGTYSLVFTSSLETGYGYTDGSTESKNVNVVLTNLSFKDAVINDAYDYDSAIKVYEIAQLESVQALQTYLTQNSNEQLNKVVNNVKATILDNSTNIESLQYVNNSIVKVGNNYQLSLLASSKAKHLFADGSSQKTITINLTSVEFAKVGATLSNSAYQFKNNDGTGAFAELKSMTASLANAEKWLTSESTVSWLNQKLSSSKVVTNASVSLVAGSIKAVNSDLGFSATFNVTGSENYIFEDGIRTKQMTITFENAGWKFASASTNNYSHFVSNTSQFWGPNQQVQNSVPNYNDAVKYVVAFGKDKVKGFAASHVSNAIISNDYKVSVQANGHINVQFTATAKDYYRFANGTKTTTVTVTLTNVQWQSVSTDPTPPVENEKYAVAANARFDAKNISWFSNYNTDSSIKNVREWLVNNGGLQVVNNKLIQDGVLKNASLVYEGMWDVTTSDYYADDNHIQTLIKVKANDGYTFEDGSTTKTIEVVMDNMPWKK